MNYKIIYITLFIIHNLCAIGQHTVPSQVKATQGDYETRIILTWNGLSDGKYEIYKASSPKLNNMKFLASIRGNQPKKFIDTGQLLLPGKKYYYTLKHITNHQKTNFSNIAMGFTAPVVFASTPTPKFPSIPIQFSTEEVIDFQWTAVIDAVQYEFQISTNPNSWNIRDGFMDNSVLKNRTTDTIFSKNTADLVTNTYYWTVKAIQATEKSLHSYFTEPIAFEVEDRLLGSNSTSDIRPTYLFLTEQLKKETNNQFKLTINSKNTGVTGIYKVALILSNDDIYQEEGEGDILLTTVSTIINGLGEYNIQGSINIPPTISKGKSNIICVPIINNQPILKYKLVVPVLIE